MSVTASGFDFLLAISVPLLAWYVLSTRDLFKAVVLFIAYGLLFALIWVRLQAPDVALAEAAIGAGLTGALLLDTLGRIGSRDAEQQSQVCEEPHQLPRTLVRGLPAGLTVVSGLALIWVIFSLPEQSVGLADEVQHALPDSGVNNPVTAVLLNFRSYDTLLEIGVLLLAVVAVWSLHAAPTRGACEGYEADTLVLPYLVRLLVPIMLVVGGYIVWVGSSRPGGAFQGGAVFAAAGVLLLLAAMVRVQFRRRWPIRVALALGLGVFLAVATGTVVLGNNLLEYPRGWAYTLIVIIETLLAISIGFTLALLFYSAPPETGTDVGEEQHKQVQHESV